MLIAIQQRKGLAGTSWPDLQNLASSLWRRHVRLRATGVPDPHQLPHQPHKRNG
jgi:hypothetical protein